MRIYMYDAQPQVNIEIKVTFPDGSVQTLTAVGTEFAVEEEKEELDFVSFLSRPYRPEKIMKIHFWWRPVPAENGELYRVATS
jgi:hypothetical protein